MSTQILTIKNDAETGELYLEVTDASPSPEFVTFINASDTDCGVWFDNEATFGLSSFRLGIDKMRRFLYGSQKTNYALFKLPQPNRRPSAPDDIPVGN